MEARARIFGANRIGTWANAEMSDRHVSEIHKWECMALKGGFLRVDHW